MFYTSFPDTAVFVVNGRTVATTIKWDSHGHGVLPITGEKLLEVMKRVDSTRFFRDGEPMEGKFAHCSF